MIATSAKTKKLALSVGDKAPDFAVAFDSAQNISSDSLQGKYKILYFYPKDDTPGCTLKPKISAIASKNSTPPGPSSSAYRKTRWEATTSSRKNTACLSRLPRMSMEPCAKTMACGRKKACMVSTIWASNAPLSSLIKMPSSARYGARLRWMGMPRKCWTRSANCKSGEEFGAHRNHNPNSPGGSALVGTSNPDRLRRGHGDDNSFRSLGGGMALYLAGGCCRFADAARVGRPDDQRPRRLENSWNRLCGGFTVPR